MFSRSPVRLAWLVALLCLPLTAIAPAAAAARSILVFGDSLSAGYGIRSDAAWPVLLDKRLKDKGFDYNVVNASISGETSSGGRSRLDAALARHKPNVVIIALGANDGLRGLPLGELRSNLLAMVDAAQRAKARVLIVGQRLPPNYGPYAEQFHALFGDVARARKAATVPFLLEGIAAERRWFQPDGIHPTAEAQPLLLDNVWPALLPLLK